MIEVQNLTKSYGGITAIQSLNFKVNKGEVVGFLGPNGAGKSTTMKIITGFMAPTSGRATVGGYDVFENPIEVKKRIGYLPETPPVYGDMKVRDYLKYVAELKGVPKDRMAKNVERAIEKTSLGAVEKRLIQNLSKGFRQRVGIAQALVSEPEVLILDEPTVGLDPKQVAEIRDLIKELRGQHTIILSTHILPEVQATCERIIIIHRGQIVAQDSLANLTNLKAGQRRVQLKVRKAKAQLDQSLSSVNGVIGVQAGAGDQDWMIDADASEDMIERIASHVIQKGYGLLEITSAKADLEDVFLKLTYGSNQAATELEQGV
ncbi:MAG: MFS transporter [Bdellovibrio sp. CG10_big_fil_rev_8_21_14_0_10_47_8]|nr:MAG: MFS transporter [Bdellovibrio sp. CG10_big_fil_rev_8_21_14_0_10_47_8]